MSIYGTNVGGIYYDVTLETKSLVDGEREVSNRLNKMGRDGERFASRMTAVAVAIKALAAAYAAIKFADMADEWGQYDSRMKMATRSAEEHVHAQRRMRASANETFRAINETRESFIQMSPVLRTMGLTLDQSIDAIDTFSGLLVVNAASAERGRAAQEALSKALQKGRVDADAWASIASTMPSIVELIAKTTGKASDEIRRLGAEGKLSVTDLTRSLVQGNAEVMASVREMPTTVKDAIQNLNNGIFEYVGQVNKAWGATAILTEIVNGAGEVMAQLATQMSEANEEAAKLGGNTSVVSWADRTKTVLSYVVDAADFVKRGFLQMGTAIGGAAAAAAMAAQGEFRAAAETMRATWKDVQDIGNAPYAGARMRAAWESGDTGGSGRKSEPLNIKQPGATEEERRKYATRRAAAQAYYEGLLADTRTGLARIDAEEQKALQDNARRAAADAANAGIYAKAKTLIVEKYARERAQLQEQYAQEAAAAEIAIQTNEQARLKAIRDEAFRAADESVRLGVKTVQQAEQAKRVAAFQFGMAMVDAADRAAQAEFEMHLAMTENAEERIALIERETVRAAELAFAMGRITEAELAAARARASRESAGSLRDLDRQRGDVRMDTLQTRASAGGVEDQVAVVRAEAERRLQASIEAQQRDLANAQLYADQRVAIEQEMYRRISEMRSAANANALAANANAFGQLTEALRSETGKQDAIYKASFIAQKAFAIASAIVNIQAGVAQAANLPFPANLGAMASVIAATASIISTIKSANYGGGRQFGGPVSAGSMYRVNESGRPEMFTAANGAQYMLPTRDGRVTSADKVAGETGGGRGQARAMTVVQNFHIAGGPADLRTQQQIAAAAARGLQTAAARNN